MEQKDLERARLAASPEELLTLAKENGIELTEEEAAAYFAQLHPVSGELSDDDLDNVSGGGCHDGDGYLVVTILNRCPQFRCKKCGSVGYRKFGNGVWDCYGCGSLDTYCKDCSYCSYERGLWLCKHPEKKK